MLKSPSGIASPGRVTRVHTRLNSVGLRRDEEGFVVVSQMKGFEYQLTCEDW